MHNAASVTVTVTLVHYAQTVSRLHWYTGTLVHYAQTARDRVAGPGFRLRRLGQLRAQRGSPMRRGRTLVHVSAPRYSFCVGHAVWRP